jgi:hypothetical protein
MTDKIAIIQHNAAKNLHNVHTALEIGLRNEIDVILFQEIPKLQDGTPIIQHTAYHTIIPNCKNPRTAICISKKAEFQFCYRTDLIIDPDIIVLDILHSAIPDMQIINIYNERTLVNGRNVYTIERCLDTLIPLENTLISGDFNAHHAWWNTAITRPIRTEILIPWLEKFEFELVNKPDISTFNKPNIEHNSVIDLAFTSKKLSQK